MTQINPKKQSFRDFAAKVIFSMIWDYAALAFMLYGGLWFMAIHPVTYLQCLGFVIVCRAIIKLFKLQSTMTDEQADRIYAEYFTNKKEKETSK